MGRIDEIAQALSEAELDGWLFYDFRLSDPLAYRILGLSDTELVSRRWFYFIGAAGTTRALVSAVRAHRLAPAPRPGRAGHRTRAGRIPGVGRNHLGGARIRPEN